MLNQGTILYDTEQIADACRSALARIAAEEDKVGARFPLMAREGARYALSLLETELRNILSKAERETDADNGGERAGGAGETP
mgnify:CR=1 FL=1